MFEHRFREFLNQPLPAALAAPNVAFVPCPCPAFHPAQQAFVAEVYRVARQMTEAQLRKPTRPRMPQFSAN